MTTLFVDTNILLHAKPLSDIQWEDRHKPPITIIITRTNIKELDKHKDLHSKRHIRERARKVLQRILEATTNPKLREHVTLRVDNTRRQHLDLREHDLDPASEDDQLVASALHYREQHAGETVILYTHDVGPQITAQRVGLTARQLPDDDKLPPQRDETELENERLKRELYALQAAAPQLHLSVNGRTDTATPNTLGPIPPPLDEQAINSRATAARAKLPTFNRGAKPPSVTGIATNGEFGVDVVQYLGFDFDAIANSEYTRYELGLAGYESDYRAYLRKNHDAQVVRARTIAIAIVLHNDGGKPAEDINVDIELPEYVTIATDPPWLVPPPAKPTPPQSQQAIMSETLQRSPRIDFPYFPPPDINPSKRGPWIEGNKVSWWVRTLNHGFVRDLGELYATIDGLLKPISVTCTIHAANMVTPFNGKIIIKPCVA